MLTSKQRAYLRGMANPLDAIFQVGKGGINDNFIAQISDVLEVRELIKITVLNNADTTAREVANELAEATGADVVQVIGSKLVLYRASTEKPTIELP